MRKKVPECKPTRREAIQAALAAVPLLGFNWNAYPSAQAGGRNSDEFDAVIIGSGLGGLSCAAAFARKGYRALVLEQHDKPGGYATAFRRPGGFVFDVSLHSTTIGERNGVRNLIGGFPEITEVEFVPHTHLYRAVFPEHDVRVPQRDVPGYAALLVRLFPEEKAGIEALIEDIQALSGDVGRLSAAQGKVDMSRFPVEFPALYRCAQQTWGQMVDARLRNPKLKAIVSAMWSYYGLPPSRLSSFYYALPTDITVRSYGAKIDAVPPGIPVELQGLSGLPAAGQKFAVLKDERTARQIATYRQEKERDKAVARPKFSLEELHRRIEVGDLKELNIVVKADVQGSMEALQFSLAKLSGDKVKVNVIHAGVGGISESDVMLASASTAVVIGFNVRPESKGAELAERERVDVRLYTVIYDVIEDIHKAMEGLLEPSFKEAALGRAEVRNTFHISKIGTIAGCYVLSGKIARSASVRLLRDSVVIHDGKLASLKRFKDDVREVTEGYECGIGFEGFNDIKVGDQIEAYVMEKVVETL